MARYGNINFVYNNHGLSAFVTECKDVFSCDGIIVLFMVIFYVMIKWFCWYSEVLFGVI